MRCFYSLSLLVALLAASCVRLRPPHLARDRSAITRQFPVSFFDSSGSGRLFKATMDIKNHHLTGVLMIKRMNVSVCRVVFASEIGMTFFDLELGAGGSRVVSCFGPLNKKFLTNIFITDFTVLPGINKVNVHKQYLQDTTRKLVYSGKAGSWKIWQSYSSSGDTLLSQSANSSLFDPVIISYDHYHLGFPAVIRLYNPVPGMTFSLKLLD